MLTPEEQDRLIKPYTTLLASIAQVRSEIDAQLRTWFDTEIDAGRADLTHGFTNSEHNDKLAELEMINQAVVQYKEFMTAYFIKDTTIEFDSAQQVVLEYYSALEQQFNDFKAANGLNT